MDSTIHRRALVQRFRFVNATAGIVLLCGSVLFVFSMYTFLAQEAGRDRAAFSRAAVSAENN